MIEFVKWFYLIGTITIAFCVYIYINLYAKSYSIEKPFEGCVIDDDFDNGIFSLYVIHVTSIIGSIIAFNRDNWFYESSKTPHSLILAILLLGLIMFISIDPLYDIIRAFKKYKHNKPIKL